MAQTRASWTLDVGIAKRWEAAGLDALFRSYWTASNAADFEPLSDTEARPGTPKPYCVYEKETPVIEGHHSGAGDTPHLVNQQLQRIGVQFTVHAENTSSEYGKDIAQALMTEVMAAYDPGTDALDIAPDCQIVIFRGPDFHIREGDEEWAWVCMYDYLIDATYNA